MPDLDELEIGLLVMRFGEIPSLIEWKGKRLTDRLVAEHTQHSPVEDVGVTLSGEKDGVYHYAIRICHWNGSQCIHHASLTLSETDA